MPQLTTTFSTGVQEVKVKNGYRRSSVGRLWTVFHSIGWATGYRHPKIGAIFHYFRKITSMQV